MFKRNKEIYKYTYIHQTHTHIYIYTINYYKLHTDYQIIYAKNDTQIK